MRSSQAAAPTPRGPTRADLAAAAKEFRHMRRYLFKVLTHEASKVASDADVEYFIMRLDFNGYYTQQAQSAKPQ